MAINELAIHIKKCNNKYESPIFGEMVYSILK